MFRRAIRVAARRADAIVCVSERTAQRLGELCAPTGRVFVVPHGVDHDRFRPEPDPRPARVRDRRRPLPTTSSSSGSACAPRTSCSWAPSSPARRCPTSWPPSTGWPPTERRCCRWCWPGNPAGVRRPSRGPSARPRRRPHRPHRVRPRRSRAGAPAPRRGGRVSRPRGGVRASRPRSPGVWRHPSSPRRGRPWPRCGGSGGSWSRRGRWPSSPTPCDEVLDGGAEVEARRRLGLEVAARHTWEASAARPHVGLPVGGARRSDGSSAPLGLRRAGPR